MREFINEDTGLYYTFERFSSQKNPGDIKYCIWISNNGILSRHNDEKMKTIKFISYGYDNYTEYNIIKTRIQCFDGSYLEVNTLCRELCYHLDRVELETYYFPDDIKSLDEFVSKRCDVDIRSYHDCRK